MSTCRNSLNLFLHQKNAAFLSKHFTYDCKLSRKKMQPFFKHFTYDCKLSRKKCCFFIQTFNLLISKIAAFFNQKNSHILTRKFHILALKFYTLISKIAVFLSKNSHILTQKKPAFSHKNFHIKIYSKTQLFIQKTPTFLPKAPPHKFWTLPRFIHKQATSNRPHMLLFLV
jgi:DNA mismatch repair ATPase MutL